MNFPRRSRRSRAQSMTEYMLMIAVVSIGAMIALEWFSDPGNPVQTAGENLTQNFEQGLSNASGNMTVR